MRQVKFTHQERLSFVETKMPAVWESIKNDLAYPARVKEIMDFNEVPTGYFPEPIDMLILTHRVRTALEVLGTDSVGWTIKERLMTNMIRWVGIRHTSSVKVRYHFQLEDGSTVVCTIKSSLENLKAQQIWKKYVLREGGNEAGVQVAVFDPKK